MLMIQLRRMRMVDDMDDAWMMIQLRWKIMLRFRMRMRIGRISVVCLVIRTSTALDAHLYYDNLFITIIITIIIIKYVIHSLYYRSHSICSAAPLSCIPTATCSSSAVVMCSIRWVMSLGHWTATREQVFCHPPTHSATSTQLAPINCSTSYARPGFICRLPLRWIPPSQW